MSDSIENVIDMYGDWVKWAYSNLLNEMILKYEINSYPEKIFLANWMSLSFSVRKNIEIIPQFKVKNYRLDFYIPSTKIGIEIDSVAFHERNTKQLEYERKRHREIEATGIRIVRFAATEIIRNPITCVGDLLVAASGEKKSKMSK